MSSVRYLLDEQVDPKWRTQLIWQAPDLVVWIIGDPGAPKLDPDILLYLPLTS